MRQLKIPLDVDEAEGLETLQLIERGAVKTALLYVAGSLIICVFAALAGVVLARSL